MPRLYAVGDIHGCLTHLTRLVEKVPFDPEDTIVFIGDYIDRGEDSKGTVEFLLHFREEYPGSIFLRGNHEDMFEDYLFQQNRYQREVYLMNGGSETLQAYGLDPWRPIRPQDFPSDHLEFMRNTEFMYQQDGFLFVHAGLRSDLPLEDQDRMALLWVRQEFFEREHPFGVTVVFGHTPLRDIFENLPFAIGIDTGAVFGGQLTCVELADGDIQTVYQT